MLSNYKTLLFNLAASVIAVLVGFDWITAFPSFPWIAPLVVTFGNIALGYFNPATVGVSDKPATK